MHLLLPPAARAAARPVMLPSDLGATTLDVSGYPAAYQRTYHELFVTKCAFCHTTARAINAPYLEVPRDQLARYGAVDPPAESARGVLVSETVWRDYVTRMWHRPPCCDRCPTFSRAEAVRLWEFLVYDSIRRKTGVHAAAWALHRRRLLAQFTTRSGGTDEHARVPADPVPAVRLARRAASG